MNAEDEHDFEEFVRQRSTALLRTAYLLTGDRGHAEDLLQSVFLKVARHWSGITGPVEPYARRALVNAAVDGWRRLRVVEAPLDVTRHAAPTSDSNATVDLRDELVQALSALAPRQRAVLVLRYFEDMAEADIADALGCSRGAVKSHASRGLARLRELTDTTGETRRVTTTAVRSTP